MTSGVLLILCLSVLVLGTVASSSFTLWTGTACTGTSVTGSGPTSTSASNIQCFGFTGVSDTNSASIQYASGAASVALYSDTACKTAVGAITAATPNGSCGAVVAVSGYLSGSVTSNSAFSGYSVSLPLIVLLALLALIVM